MTMQLALLETALASWPRRQAPLLEINCGNGAFLHFLWQCGFDVHGCESDADLRLKAQRRAVPGVEIYAADDRDLPFEDDSFDWAIVHLKTGDSAAIATSAGEAARLARRGIMLTFWNNASLPALSWRLSHRRAWIANAPAWWSVWRILNRLDNGHATVLSTLALPTCAWRHGKSGRCPAWLPLGAWCAAKLDLNPRAPATPMPLRLNLRLSQPEPIMEFAPKRTGKNNEDI